ncbi:hypothetical protein HAX54_052856 [Datura stramonium]|uniref:MAGE domain-containing protein n=1 Tax=Datura stramonium TaxID=4076 RepID=A0ABS8WR10_DATST|nr:hypothetical protein [Datura stramonium]
MPPEFQTKRRSNNTPTRRQRAVTTRSKEGGDVSEVANASESGDEDLGSNKASGTGEESSSRKVTVEEIWERASRYGKSFLFSYLIARLCHEAQPFTSRDTFFEDLPEESALVDTPASMGEGACYDLS